ncbi:MAG: ImmA/IrrE family metallo-endopeptidase [Bacteroidia bacterium]|nr:ImmA/IrrE family metallo-endopeptidase [Bacteroidia bacterium]
MNHFPERLKSARRMRGFSLQELADKMGNLVSKQAISKYETGQMLPEGRVLVLISNALSLPLEYFHRQNTIELQKIAFRKLKGLAAKETEKIQGMGLDYLERYLELEAILGIEHQFENPIHDLQIRSSRDIEIASLKIREYWKMGNDPVFNVLELLEDLKIKVLQISAENSFSGLSSWVNGKIPFIVLNTKGVAANRLRFTALHELGHLVLNIQHLPEKIQEQYCNQFAGALLLPAEKLEAELGGKRQNILIQELGHIKQQYGISMLAILIRAKELELISQSYFNRQYRAFRENGYLQKEPYPYLGYEKSNRFEQLLFRGVAEEIISTSKAAALNNQKLSDFRKLLMTPQEP